MQMDRAERDRVATLTGYGIMDTPNEPDFDAIVRQTKQALNVPIVLISLLDEHRQWFKARIGLDVTETPRCISFCTHALRGPSVLVIPDARADERFADNPLVVGEPHIRFYAGAPLVAENGRRIGTLCVIDTAPRAGLPAFQEAQLTALASRTMEAMERRKVRRAAILTGRSAANGCAI
ncbi:MAG: GAF domain-containing protein [Oxalobacteraceae bacterium]|nr:MAG: GAF domain-containing protein [Oxalobacteraceae bacterium]